jgi:hypothetical protein
MQVRLARCDAMRCDARERARAHERTVRWG